MATTLLEPTLFFGGIDQGWHIASTHFAIIGETGSGKTATMRMLMNSALQQRNQNIRLVVFDPKSQFVPLLTGLSGELPLISHIGDKRAVGWDMARDCRTLKSCRSIAHVLLPMNPNNKDPFFATASRTLLTAVLRAFVESKVDWSFRDAVIAMRDVDRLREVLARSSEGRRIVKLYFGVRTTLLNVMSTVANDMDPYLEVAAAWDAAEKKFCIRDFVKGDENRVLVLGHDDENEQTSKCVNQVLFQRLKQSLLTPPFEKSREMFVFLDELTLGGFPPKALLRLADMGRELGVRLVLSSLGIDGAIEEYGERLTYQLFGSCVNQALLRTSSSRTAKFFSEQLGKYETIEVQHSTSYGPGGNSRSESQQKVIRDAAMASQWQTMPVASRHYGFDGVYLGELGAWDAHIGPSEIKQRIGNSDPSVHAFLPHDTEPALRPWDQADCIRLGLPQDVLDEIADSSADGDGDDQTAGISPKSNAESCPQEEKVEGGVWQKLKGLVGKKGIGGAAKISDGPTPKEESSAKRPNRKSVD